MKAECQVNIKYTVGPVSISPSPYIYSLRVYFQLSNHPRYSLYPQDNYPSVTFLGPSLNTPWLPPKTT